MTWISRAGAAGLALIAALAIALVGLSTPAHADGGDRGQQPFGQDLSGDFAGSLSFLKGTDDRYGIDVTFGTDENGRPSATVSYPSLGCAATWSYVSGTKRLNMLETITAGDPFNCGTTTRILLRDLPGKKVSVRLPDYNQSGTIKPVDPCIPARSARC